MRRFSFIITILLLTLVSCAESGIKEYRNDYQVAPERLTATFEGVESTRIELQELNSVWSAGDEVSVFYHSYSNLKYKFDGNSGDSAGTLSLVAGEQGEATLDKSYMLYPYSENNSLGEDGMLYTSLPAEQSYKANSYGVGGNILVAESTTSQFVLNNVCGWIRIQLTGDGEVVHSITLSSNKNEALAGDIMVNSSDAGYTLMSSGGSSITLDCGEGVTLSESVTEFYIGILPQGLEGGITVDIVTDQDSVSKSTYKAVVVERNHILPMTAFRLSGEEAVHSELRYTATALVEPNNTSAFNAAAAIVSNEWNEETGEGVITFDGELTMIGYEAFSNCTSLTSVTIPNSVTTIEERAFIGCSSLTSVTIGNSVTMIGIGVFCGCINLAEFKGKFAEDGGRCLIIDGVLNAFAFGCGVTEYTIPDSVTTIGDMALYNCDSLTSVTIPDSVTTIGVWAFYVCDSLTSVTIGDSVTTIGDSAFYYCSSLTSVYCEATTPPTLGDSYVFDDNASGRKIYVPSESVEAYKAAENWNKYAAGIVGYNFETGEEVAISNKLFYTATAKVEPYKASAFNAAIVSNEWDEETGEGVITFDGELTTIGDRAFYDCDSLTSVTIPDSVTTIGDHAFYDCDSLTSVTIPDSVTTIGDHAFYYCSSLTSVTIPDSVTTIGNSAFRYCDSLTSVTIPDSVTTIGSYAFTSCSSLTEFKGKFAADGGRCLIKDNTLIAYANASGTTYTIPDSVTTIGDEAFSGCFNLTSITIPDSVTTIGEGAFNCCYRLTSVTIPNSVTTIGDYAFRYCSSLVKFEGKFASEDGCCLIVDGVLTAFALGCDTTEYTIPDSVTSIGEGAFYDCSSLTSVTIPDSVTTIGGYAFSGCDSLTSVTIPDSVTTIGNYAFRSCDSLTSVYCEATTPPTLGSNVFKTYNNGYVNIGCPIYVPAESVEAYKAAAGWSDYAADIVGYDFGAGEETPEVPEVYELAYTTNDGKPLDPYTTEGFGGEFMENIYDAATGRGVLKFAGAVTTIPEQAFGLCENLTWIDIPEGITTIGASAFTDCSALEELTIPSTLTSLGSEAFQNCSFKATINCGNVSFKGVGFTEVIIGDGVTTIGEWSFRYCDRLTSFTIGDSVTTIGYGAFDGCSSLTSVIIGESVTTIGTIAFNNCNSLTSITIPNSVTTIGNSAFKYCSSLAEFKGKFAADGGRCLIKDNTLIAYAEASGTTYTIPDSVTTIGNYAFSECSSLTSVTIPDSVTSIGNYAFHVCESLTSVTIPDSVTTIGYCAFSYCRSLTSVTIPDSVTSIGNSAFDNCSSLTSVTIGNSVTTIGNSAFYYCSSLSSVTIPDSVTTIGNEAFRYCTSLTSVTIPDSITTIGASAFRNCENLTSVYCKATTPPTSGSSYVFDDNASSRKIYVPEGSLRAYKLAENWSEYADHIVEYDFNSTMTISYTTSDGMPANANGLIVSNSYQNGVGELKYFGKDIIPAGIFRNCDNLTSVTIPDSVTTIGERAFYDCDSLTSVTIPDSVTTIGDYAFYSCGSLTSVTIPDSVTTIGYQVFYYCSNLTSVYCKATTPPTLDGSSVFYSNKSGRKIYVPAESVEAYKAATNWSEYAVNIVGYDFETGEVVE